MVRLSGVCCCLERRLTSILARHLMTGTGAYFYLVWGIWLRHCLNGRQDEYDLHWPGIFSLPVVVRSRGRRNDDGEAVSKKTS